MNESTTAAAEDERGLLAGLIFEPHRIGRIATELSPSDFVDRAHGELFAALVDLADAGTDIRDTHLVVLHCRRAGLVDRLGGLATFHRDFIEGMAGTPGNATRYADAIRRRSVDRSIAALADELRDGTAPPEQRLDRIEAAVASIRSRLSAGSTESTIGEIHRDLLADIEASIETSRLPSMQTGIDCIDDVYGGLMPDTLTVLAARPSVGKSTLGFQIARNVAERGGHVRFVSLEMSRPELGARDLAARTGVNGKAINTHAITRYQLDLLRQKVEALGDLPMRVDAPHGRSATIEAIAAAAKVQHRESPLSLFVVDYMQIIRHSDNKDRDYDRTTRAVRRLRELSRELNCPVIALSQLNRDAAGAKDAEPGLHHLRESGAIEQDANNVVFLHRPDVESPATKLIVAKWRGGDRGKFNLWLDGPSTRFVEEPIEQHPNYVDDFAEFS